MLPSSLCPPQSFWPPPQLDGSLPPEWSGLQSLQSLDASANRLSGFVPAAWSSLRALFRLSLRGCEGVCGDVPPGLEAPLAAANGTQATALGAPCYWEGDGACSALHLALPHSPPSQSAL